MTDKFVNDINQAGPDCAEQEISTLYRHIANEQPLAELDNTILHLARNKDLLQAKPEDKPVSLMDRIKSHSGPLAMAASVVLVGSIVLLQDWREEVLPKRYGPQSGGGYDYAAPPTPQATSAPNESAVMEQGLVPDSSEPEDAMATSARQAGQQGLTLDKRLHNKQSSNQVQSRFRSQPELERRLPPADTQVERARFKAKFDQSAKSELPEVQAYPAPDLIVETTPEKLAPAADEKADSLDSKQEIQAVSSQPMLEFAASDAQLQHKPPAVWLKEIEILLEIDEQAVAIKELKAFVDRHPDYPLSEKYQKLLALPEE